MSCHACPLRPKSRGQLTLASADPRAMPHIDPNFLSHIDDLETLVRGFKLVRRIFAQSAFAPFDGANPARELYDREVRSDDEIRDAIRRRADTIYHPVGTCRQRGRPRAARARRERPARGRRLGHAEPRVRQHQRADGDDRGEGERPDSRYSTVTDFARLRGLSTSVPRASAV
jgi:hypothetical protein